MTDVYNAADRKSVRRAEKEAKLASLSRREVLAGIMSTSAGRAWILETLESAHVFSTSFSSSGLAMAFAEGERNQGLRLFNDVVAACPDEYVQMMREHNVRDTLGTVRRSSSNPNGGDQGSESWEADGADDDGAEGTNGAAAY